MRKSLLAALFLLFNHVAYAQLDKEFWFAAPAISDDHSAENNCGCNDSNSNPSKGRCGAAPVSLNISNFYNYSTDVTIEIPADKFDPVLNPNGFKTINVTVPPNTTERVVLWDNDICDPNNIKVRKQVENLPIKGNVQQPLDKAIHITSTNFVTVYYEVEEQNNSDVFALKGENALGDLFYVPFQTNEDNSANVKPDIAFSSIVLLATEDNTVIDVYPTNEVLGFGSSPFTITLDKGQSISLLPGPAGSDDPMDAYQDPGKRLAGTKIVARDGKRIAVTKSDDSVWGDTGCYDLLGDQIIPVEKVLPNGTRQELIGTEYIIMKGDLGSGNNDRAYIVATQDNTHIIVTELASGVTTDIFLDEGEEYKYTIPDGIPVTQIVSDDVNKPIYVLHITGAGNGCELGGAVLPSISKCTGSFNVGFSRGSDSGKDFKINVLMREKTDGDPEGHRNSFILTTKQPDGTVITNNLDGTQFVEIPNSDWWAAQFTVDYVEWSSSNILTNTDSALFHLGTLNGGKSNGGNYGYFSNYGSIRARSYVSINGDIGFKMCIGDSVSLVADGGSSYEWEPKKYLDDPFSPQPVAKPRENIKYTVYVRDDICDLEDTAYVTLLVSDSISAHFELDKYDACAPTQIKIANKSFDPDGNNDNYWNFDSDPVVLNNDDTLTMQYENKTDTAVEHTIKLTTINRFCSKNMEQKVIIYPEIHTGFEVDTTFGCHPLTVSFNDTTVGNIDSTRYNWNFGDSQISVIPDPTHTYQNIGSKDTTYHVKLVTTSPYLCKDSAEIDINVFPYIKAEFATDSSISCSPASIKINPQGSIGTDTLFWQFDDSRGRFNDAFFRENRNLITYDHNDITQDGPDTIRVNMHAVNEYGCRDTADQQRLLIYPEIHSRFEPDLTDICDSVEVVFVNQSTSSPFINYTWNYGDQNSTFSDDNKDMAHRYFNLSDADTSYSVSLIAENEWLCRDTADTNIIVHPYINADFNLAFSTNCSPINTQIENLSHRAHNYDWDFGDGTVSNTSNDEFGHLFENPSPDRDTTFFVKLRVSNNEGCYDSIVKPLLLYPQVVADFDMDVDAGCQPLTVEFSNLSSGNKLSYLWEFGDNTSSTADIPVFSKDFYNYSGNDTLYNISLRAVNTHGCDSIISDSVMVYSFVDARFSIQNADSCSPFNVVANNATPPGASQYVWTFGDGSPAEITRNITHEYRNTGLTPRTDSLKLEVRNSHGCTDSQSRPVLIYPEVNASFFPDVDEGCQPLDVRLFNNTNIKDSMNFSWNFDDGELKQDVSGNPVDHTFINKTSTDKTFNVRMLATSAYGCTDSAQTDIIAYRQVKAAFDFDSSAVCYGSPVQIFNQSSEGSTQFNWDFDNGQTELRFDHNTFTREWPGDADGRTYQVELIASYDGQCEDTIIHPLTIHPQIRPHIAFSDTAGCHPHWIDFNNLSENVDGQDIYSWDLAGMGESNSYQPKSRYFFNETKQDKFYPVALYAEDRLTGCSGSDTLEITVHANPIASFRLNDPMEGCAPHRIRVDNLSTQVTDKENSYKWIYGDGNDYDVNDKSAVEHTYYNESPNNLNPKLRLIAYSDAGCSDTIREVLSIHPMVSASFSFEEDKPDKFSSAQRRCSPVPIIFTNESVNAQEYDWEFGDGNFSTAPHPVNTFENQMEEMTVYNIQLHASSVYGCEDDTTVPIKILPQPIANFYALPVSQYFPESQVNIINRTELAHAWEYVWQLGDTSKPIYEVDPKPHDYGYWGDYKISQQVTYHPEGEPFFCVDTTSQWVEIKPAIPVPAFDSSYAGCVPLTVQFFDNSYYGITHEWDFGDSTTYISGPGENPDDQLAPFGEVITHTYTEPGKYLVMLKVQGVEEARYAYQTVTVYPKPTVQFEVYPQVVMLPDEKISTYNKTELGSRYQWDFGDDTYSSLQAPEHQYTELGTYDVTLISWTNQGCADTLTLPDAVSVEGEGFIEFPDAFMPELGGPNGGYWSENDWNNPFIFRPYAKGIVDYSLEIYNRWGELVFETENLYQGWDGYVDSKLANQEVYVWRAKGTFTNGQKFVKAGDVTVLHAPREPGR